METEKKKLVVYNGGHILNEAMVMYRNKQEQEINAIKGIKCYNVLNDKSINDKANAVQEGLAERILKNDFKAMQEADIFVFDILNEGLGSLAELSIVLGMKHEAQKIVDCVEHYIHELNMQPEGNEAWFYKQALETLNKPVLVYCSDIRQGHGKPYTDPDRAEFSTNQFIFGEILHLTNGEGFISWEEVLKRLEKLGNSHIEEEEYE